MALSTERYIMVRFRTEHPDPACVSTSNSTLKARTHRDEYRRALFASVFRVHTQAIFADDEPSEHANSFPDIRWRLM